MDFYQARAAACKELTLVDAVSFMCAWQAARLTEGGVSEPMPIGGLSGDEPRWDTSHFKFCVASTVGEWRRVRE